MAKARILAGVCGFTTEVDATSVDRQHVTLYLSSECPALIQLAEELDGLTIDLLEELGIIAESGSIHETTIMRICRSLPHMSCPVPAGICKAAEVAAGMALARDALIELYGDTNS